MVHAELAGNTPTPLTSPCAVEAAERTLPQPQESHARDADFGRSPVIVGRRTEAQKHILFGLSGARDLLGAF